MRSMLIRLFSTRMSTLPGLFNGHFVDPKVLYAHRHNAVCCIRFIGELDTSKSFAFISEMLQNEILETIQHSYFDHGEQKTYFNNTLFILSNRRMIELGSNYCQLLFTSAQHSWANRMVENLAAFREKNQEPVIGFTRQAAN